MALLERQRVCKCLCLCCFPAQPEPLITGPRVKPAKRSRNWNGGDVQTEPCQELTRAGMLGSGPLCSFASVRSLVSGHRLLLSPLEQAHLLGQQLQKDLSQESMALQRKVSVPAWCKHRAHVFGVKKAGLGVRTDLATSHSH